MRPAHPKRCSREYERSFGVRATSSVTSVHTVLEPSGHRHSRPCQRRTTQGAQKPGRLGTSVDVRARASRGSARAVSFRPESRGPLVAALVAASALVGRAARAFRRSCKCCSCFIYTYVERTYTSSVCVIPVTTWRDPAQSRKRQKEHGFTKDSHSGDRLPHCIAPPGTGIVRGKHPVERDPRSRRSQPAAAPSPHGSLPRSRNAWNECVRAPAIEGATRLPPPPPLSASSTSLRRRSAAPLTALRT